nr:uncharacterized protein LOC109193148 isoform X1 [Ipomoea batatas]
MGFAALLDFNVNECPPRLVYWLLSNFDGETRVFDLGGGRSLALEERDVELVLGFPRGPIEMVKRDRMHFCMLVLSTFVACMRNGYANQMYFHHFDDVKWIQDLNWCKLLVDSLVETQAAWKSGSHKCFVGPAEFVAFLYVDRVLHFARPVSRVVPACRGWSLELLQQRELSEIRLGGFGHSVIELPLFDGRNVDSGAGHPQGSDDVGFNDGVCAVVDDIARDYGPMGGGLLLMILPLKLVDRQDGGDTGLRSGGLVCGRPGEDVHAVRPPHCCLLSGLGLS